MKLELKYAKRIAKRASAETIKKIGNLDAVQPNNESQYSDRKVASAERLEQHGRMICAAASMQ